jgi:succinoglycan biosynthesis protein ExoM
VNKIVICIPTYKRPDQLSRLVLTISNCEVNKSLIGKINVIIVDNDIAMTAEQSALELKEKLKDKIEIDYFSYSVKGLSNVRNELLRRAIPLKSDFIVFADDDEYVSPEWLNKMVETITGNNCDMVVGHVISVAKPTVPDYISFWFQRRNHPDNKQINFAATNNLIIRTDTLLKYNLWFDNRFNQTGGEDSFFGTQMISRGGKIFWSAKAIVYETVPDSRTNIKWLAKRYYNAANKFAYILRIEKKFNKIIKKLFVSIVYIILGIFALIIALFPVKKRYWGILKIAEGCGGLTGFLSIRYEEYK